MMWILTNPWLWVMVAAVILVVVFAIWLGLRKPVPRHAVSEGPEETMYERLGITVIRVVIEQMYRRLLSDPQIGHYFTALSPDRLFSLKQHMAQLISTVLGGPEKYDLQRLQRCHQDLWISNDAYAAVVGHLLAVVWSRDAPDDIVEHLFRELNRMRPIIVPVLDSRTTQDWARWR